MIVEDGRPPVAAARHPALAGMAAPPTTRPKITAPPDAPLSGLVPYRNPPALTGYYLSILSLVPILGLALGPVAIALGVIGFRGYLRDRSRKGQVHAWIAIVLGTIGSLINWGGGLLILLGRGL